MGIKERREREKQATRQLILDAARELFVKDGYEAVTMRAIAERIEYSPTAIYVHFKDKAELLRELGSHDMLRFAEAFQRKAGTLKDPLERLRRTGEAYLAFGMEHPSTYRLLFLTDLTHQSDSAVEQGNPQQDAYAFLEQSVQAAIDADALRPELKDAGLVAQMLWAGVHGLVSLRLTMGKDDWVRWRPFRKQADLLLDVMLAGIARPGRAPAHR